jgi:hypothetical protein
MRSERAARHLVADGRELQSGAEYSRVTSCVWLPCDGTCTARTPAACFGCYLATPHLLRISAESRVSRASGRVACLESAVSSRLPRSSTSSDELGAAGSYSHMLSGHRVVSLTVRGSRSASATDNTVCYTAYIRRTYNLDTIVRRTVFNIGPRMIGRTPTQQIYSPSRGSCHCG